MQLRNIMVVFAMVLSLVSMQVSANASADTALTKSVIDSLSSDTAMSDMMKSHKIKIHVKNGAVTVSGLVDSDDLKQSISDSVKAVDGVKSVNVKQLKVTNGKAITKDDSMMMTTTPNVKSDSDVNVQSTPPGTQGMPQSDSSTQQGYQGDQSTPPGDQ